MNDHEFERFEAQLRTLKSAVPPQEFLTRLMDAQPVGLASRPGPARPAITWWWQLRWPAAAAAVIVVGLAAWLSRTADRPLIQAVHDLRPPALGADHVEIDRQLVGTYDAVAKLPSGEPVRFRCREWMEAVVLSDSVRGLVIEQRTPRLEIIPVSFDTY